MIAEEQGAASGQARLLRAAADRLAPVDDSPLLTAQALLAHVTGQSRAALLAHPERPLAPAEAAEFERLLARAAAGEPLAYLTGQREFFGLDFHVEPGVLVPRPETEQLVELALRARPRRIIDAGTGSGCIAVSLAVRLPEARVLACDISPAALAVARRNAERHGVAGRISFIQSDLLSALVPKLQAWTFGPSPERSGVSVFFDLIVANLPYIETQALPGLAVSRHEPRQALDGGPDGLLLVRRLLAQSRWLLEDGGSLLLEIGAGQAQAALAAGRAAWPAARVAVERDLAGLDRVLAIHTAPGAG